MRGNDLPGFAAPRENLIIEKVELCSSMEDRGGNCFGNTVSIYRTALEREKEDVNGRVFHLDLRGSFKIDRDFQTFFSEFYYVIIYYVSFITSFMWVFFFDERIANPILLSERSFEISEVVYRVRS